VADHFLNHTVCTPRLAAAAMVTTTLRLGSYVYDNDFRHPVLLAREAADIDLLSGGRMELGLGAGWSKREYDSVGIPFDDGATRAGRFEEAVQVIRALHRDGRIDEHVGTHYRVRDCALLVETVQRPIPLFLGGGGPRMTRFAGQHADTVGFVPRSLPGGGLDPAEFAVSAFEEKLAVLDAASADRADGGPERGVLLFFTGGSVTDMPTDPDASWTSPELLASGPYALVGDPEQMVDTLLERRERWGLTYVTCWEEDVDRLVPVVARLSAL
jgi:probable F420-dependent oxidoreductase